jgi:hypothetical protein
MHVVTVGTRVKPLRRKFVEVREVGALHERAIYSRPLFAAARCARPYTLLLTVCNAPRKPPSPTPPANEPANLGAALSDAYTLARVSRANARNSKARDYGPSRPCIGYGVKGACDSRTTAAQSGHPLLICLWSTRRRNCASGQRDCTIVFRAAHEAKATGAPRRLHCGGRAMLWAGHS